MKPGILLSFFFIFFLAGCLGTPPKEIAKCPPDEQGMYDCIVAAALENRNPELCEWVGPRLNDACGQEYYEKAGDPSACDTVKPAGIRENCREYYANRSTNAPAGGKDFPPAVTQND